jgi:hypothetical protein
MRHAAAVSVFCTGWLIQTARSTLLALLADQQGLILLAHTAESGSKAKEQLEFLASWSATQLAAQR